MKMRDINATMSEFLHDGTNGTDAWIDIVILVE